MKEERVNENPVPNFLYPPQWRAEF